MSLLVAIVVLGSGPGPVESRVTFSGAGLTGKGQERKIAGQDTKGYEMKLFGTLTIPAHTKGHAVPAVLLLPGSGPTDRNGNQPPAVMTDILKQLSDSLAKIGIASLRFDKRATRMYQPSWPKDPNKLPEFFKWENFVDDATDAYRFLATRSGIDPKRVAIIGHSEGAEIALQIGSNLAATGKGPAALVTLGGAGRPMGPILTEQISAALDKQTKIPAVKKLYMDALSKAVAQVIKNGTYPVDLPAGLKTLFNLSTTKIMRSYCTIDPSNLARKYRGPVLLINGARDTQISPDRDTLRLKAALASRKTGSVEVLIVPNASHNLKSTEDGNDDATSGPIVPSALEKIRQFLTKQLHP